MRVLIFIGLKLAELAGIILLGWALALYGGWLDGVINAMLGYTNPQDVGVFTKMCLGIAGVVGPLLAIGIIFVFLANNWELAGKLRRRMQ